ncbi:MAG: TIGR01777 family oxidoreductase [Planctomycetota bacterium]
MNQGTCLNRYVATSELPVSPRDAFAYHERPGCLERLTPPWERVRVLSSDDSLEVGSEVILQAKAAGIPVRWVARHTAYDPPHSFADTQVSGPFSQWDHRHRFESIAGGSTSLTDDITYRLPMAFLGDRLGGWKARQTIEAMFAYRHRITTDDLSLAAQLPLDPQRIAISGASGLVGSGFKAMATLLGHQCRDIVRTPAKSEDEIAVWSDPNEAAKFNEVDIVIHLAGKSIAASRWTTTTKQQIRDSRVEKTRVLSEALASCETKPRLLISASAIGIYGERGDEELTEASPVADDFLASVGKDWEAACEPAIRAGIRVVNARLGIVLSPSGGALQKSLTPAKWFGGRLGSGRQWWSWVGLDDVLGGLYHIIGQDSLSGPVNLTAPQPTRNVDFASELSHAIRRKPLFPAPGFALRLAMGEMADALLLASTRVVPNKLIQTGYRFRFPELGDQLRYCLGKNRKRSDCPPAEKA